MQSPSRTARSCTRVLIPLLAVAVAVASCGSDSDSGSGSGSASSGGGSKLIIATMGFPCSLNDFAKSLCDGFKAGEQRLPDGYRFQLKTGTDFADQNAYNNLIQTSSQLDPGGLIVFPSSAAAQVPILKQACDKKIEIMIIDNPVDGLGACQSAYIAADHEQLGREVAGWLGKHPPERKEVGIVTLAPGQVASNDDRVKGFTEAVEAAGFKVSATVPTDLTLDKTRTQVTNMLTAHPDLGAIFSANDQMGYGTAQAVANSPNKDVLQLTIDGALDAVKRIPDGLAVDAAQAPYFLGKRSVLDMAKILDGKNVPAIVYEPSKLIDETNVKQYIADGGLR